MLTCSIPQELLEAKRERTNLSDKVLAAEQAASSSLARGRLNTYTHTCTHTHTHAYMHAYIHTYHTKYEAEQQRHDRATQQEQAELT